VGKRCTRLHKVGQGKKDGVIYLENTTIKLKRDWRKRKM